MEEMINNFFEMVDSRYRDFVKELHACLMDSGYKVQVKESKSGYVVSYIFHGKTVFNYAFRKNGVFLRIYAEGLDQYREFLDTLPEEMVKAIKKAPVCKRLLDPNDCNSRCSMGYDFTIRGERYQRCRYSAFQFFLKEENNPFLKDFAMREIEARKNM